MNKPIGMNTINAIVRSYYIPAIRREHQYSLWNAYFMARWLPSIYWHLAFSYEYLLRVVAEDEMWDEV